MTELDAQGDIFFGGEGDHWFERNADALRLPTHAEQDVPLRTIGELPGTRPRRVLEIGCASGWRLSALRSRYGCSVVGVDPSQLAIAEGRRLDGDLDLRRGLSRALPIRDDETFDLVIVAFVFHWISRDVLFASMAEIDRVLDDDGFLVIHDFLPDQPTRRPYHHLDAGRVFTYKQDMALAFTGTNLYRHVSRAIQEHPDAPNSPRAIGDESENRTACDVLQKRGVYAETG